MYFMGTHYINVLMKPSAELTLHYTTAWNVKQLLKNLISCIVIYNICVAVYSNIYCYSNCYLCIYST